MRQNDLCFRQRYGVGSDVKVAQERVSVIRMVRIEVVIAIDDATYADRALCQNTRFRSRRRSRDHKGGRRRWRCGNGRCLRSCGGWRCSRLRIGILGRLKNRKGPEDDVQALLRGLNCQLEISFLRDPFFTSRRNPGRSRGIERIENTPLRSSTTRNLLQEVGGERAITLGALATVQLI